MSEPQRTALLGLVPRALSAGRGALISAAAIAFSGIGKGERLWIALGVGLAALVIGGVSAFLKWHRLTYTVGEADIRVDSGVLSRSARSVPYERIQDVSLEARPLPRLLGLVAVKFETGAGSGDDLSLHYLTAAQGEALRQLVRERREDAPAAAPVAPAAAASPGGEDSAVLYALTPARLVTFGLFEFSLAVFAVLGGMLQYVDNFTNIDVWNIKRWQGWLSQQGETVVHLGLYAQVAGALAGLVALLLIGSATGIVRTVLRDWAFTLTRSARGFRRQRGLLTRTDVVMPAHRVQGLEIGTGLVRYRFGWHSLRFVSLAQDAEGESHEVAPFARMDEIERIARAAGFRLPGDGTTWHRASKAHRDVMVVRDAAVFVIAAIPTAIYAPAGLFLIPLGLAVIAVGINLYSWEFRRDAFDDTQVYASHGFLSPVLQIAARLKLHSVEIVQGPLARARGYATVHLGLAGGTFAMHGVPIANARAVRAAVIQTISATDYSRLDTPGVADQAFRAAQSGCSANRLAT
jgi:putative membrane protein